MLWLLCLGFILIIGVSLEYYNMVSKSTEIFLMKLSIGLILLYISYMGLALFIGSREKNKQEGFETLESSSAERWKSFLDSNSILDVCSIYNKVKTQMIATATKEEVEDIFKKLIPAEGPQCPGIIKNYKETDIDKLYISINGLSDSFLIQVYQTAEACRTQLKSTVSKVNTSLDMSLNSPTIGVPITTIEGFIDSPPCSPDIVEERRKFLRDKKLAIAEQLCLLPEELGMDAKQDSIKNKLAKIKSVYDTYIFEKKIKVSISDIVQKCNMLLAQIDSFNQDAQNGKMIERIHGS